MLHEGVGQTLVVGSQGKRYMIAATQPIFMPVEIKQSVAHLKCAESGSFGKTVELAPFLVGQSECEIIQVGMLRRPQTRLKSVDTIGQSTFLSGSECHFSDTAAIKFAAGSAVGNSG